MSDFYKDYAIGIDASRYQVIDYAKLKGVIDFAILKCSEGVDWKDPSFSAHVQGFHNQDIPCIAYHYWRADSYVEHGANWYEKIKPENDPQLQNILEAIKYKDLYGLFVDSEQTGNPDPIWSVTALCNFMPRLDVALRNKTDLVGARFNAGKFIFGVYSAKWHYAQAANQYMALMAKKASNGNPYHSWSAVYPYATGVVNTTWENLKAKLLPEKMTVHSLGSPNDWTFWQFSGDKFTLPGIYSNDEKTKLSAVDLNFFNGTKEQLYSLIGFAPGAVVVPPVVPPEETVDPVWKAAVDAQLLDLAATATDLKNKVELFSEYIAWLKECPK